MRDVLDICRSNNLHQEEMLHVISEYIYDKKGVSVNCIIEVDSLIGRLTAQSQISKMFIAYDKACSYFLNKNK